jgi:acylphosphatase
MAASRRVRVVVSGRVQGVFFRASCAQEASRLGLSGWVANERDGSVEAAFEGDEEAVIEMIAWCRDGPEWARVTGVDVQDEAPIGDRGFVVRTH